MVKSAGLAAFTKKKVEPAAAEKPDRLLVQKKFMLTPTQNKRIKEFCAQQEMTQREFITEAVSLMFKSRGLPGI